MILGVQYYRPPFPNKGHWADDLPRIREAGFNTIQLWVCWGWVEPRPGQWQFDDYDELLELAAQNELGVVLSTVAEIHPFWLPREFPGTEMVDHMGRPVISSVRQECNVGLTPGGCFDHPVVAAAMATFLETVATRYRRAANLVGWDAWNELRWAVQSDGYVCYCPATLTRFHGFLQDRYGTLDGLNAAWHRRYVTWEDVMPGKLPGRTFTEMMEFLRFLTWRSDDHGAFRAQTLRQMDGRHPITLHGAAPTALWTGWQHEQSLSRGNDWNLAAVVDAMGCSHFPTWHGFDDDDFGLRMENIRAAAQGKPFWVSELQGGSARDGLEAGPALDPLDTGRWIWKAWAYGAKATIFWCWRDEVFGPEASGFGLAGFDGRAPDRLARISRLRELLDKHQVLLGQYQPDTAKVGVLFEPSTYYLEWAAYGSDHTDVRDGLVGYCRALEAGQIPYTIIETNDATRLHGLSVLIIPTPWVLDPTMAHAIGDWVEEGGLLVVEAELEGYTELGFYRDPTDPRRVLSRRLGLETLGRRPLDSKTAMNAQGLANGGTEWAWPMWGWREEERGPGRVMGTVPAAEVPAVWCREVGHGTVWHIGTLAGTGYRRRPLRGMVGWLQDIVGDAKIPGLFQVIDGSGQGIPLRWRAGWSGPSRVLFISWIGDRSPHIVVTSKESEEWGSATHVVSLVDGQTYPIGPLPGNETGVQWDSKERGYDAITWVPGSGA